MLTLLVRTVAVLVVLVSSVALSDPVNTAADRGDRSIKVTNGEPVAVGQYRFLTAVLSGRHASIRLNGQALPAEYVGGTIQRAFDGDIADCGAALQNCQQAQGKVCAIVLVPASSDAPPGESGDAVIAIFHWLKAGAAKKLAGTGSRCQINRKQELLCRRLLGFTPTGG